MHVIAHGSEVGYKIGSPTQLTDADTSNNASASTPSTSRMTSSNSSLKQTTNETVNSSANGNSGTLNVAHTHPISSLSPYHNK